MGTRLLVMLLNHLFVGMELLHPAAIISPTDMAPQECMREDVIDSIACRKKNT